MNKLSLFALAFCVSSSVTHILHAQATPKTTMGFGGLYAQIGTQHFYNVHNFDHSLYNLPTTLQWSIGGQYQYLLSNKLSSIIIHGGLQQSKVTAIAEKYNNVWATLAQQATAINVGGAFRFDWSRKSRVYIQSGISILGNLQHKNKNTGSEHQNNNDVRDYLSAIYFENPQILQLYTAFQCGVYLDKSKQNEIALGLQLPIVLYYKNGNATFMKQSFTFADSHQEDYSININGLPIRLGIQYNFWF